MFTESYDWVNIIQVTFGDKNLEIITYDESLQFPNGNDQIGKTISYYKYAIVYIPLSNIALKDASKRRKGWQRNQLMAIKTLDEVFPPSKNPFGVLDDTE